MPTILSGQSVTVNAAEQQTVALSNSVSSKARVEILTGPRAGRIVADNHHGRASYGPFAAGMVSISAIAGDLVYSLSGAADFDGPATSLTTDEVADVAEQITPVSELIATLSVVDTMRGYEDAGDLPASPNYRLFLPADESTGYVMPQAGRSHGIAQAGNDVMWSTAGYMSSKTTAAATAGGINFGNDILNCDLNLGHSMIFAATIKGAAPVAALTIAGNRTGTGNQIGWGLWATTTGTLQMRICGNGDTAILTTATEVALDGADHNVIVLIDGTKEASRIWIDRVRNTGPLANSLSTIANSTVHSLRAFCLGNGGDAAAEGSHAVSWKNVHLLTMAGGLPSNLLGIAMWLSKNMDKPIPMAMLDEPLPPEYAVPLTSAATTATKTLYRSLLSLTGAREVMLGCHDRHHGGNSPRKDGREAAFTQMTGKPPAYIQWEYVSPNNPAFTGPDAYGGTMTAAGAVGQANLIADIKAAWRRGIWPMVHWHCGNPTLDASGGMAASMANVAAYENRSGSPVAAIKTGGAKEAHLLAELDAFAAFANALVADDGTLIPFVWRPFHEMNGNWFWWNGIDRQADMVLVWRKMVDYLKTTKGLTNVLYCWNLSMSLATSIKSNATDAYSGWYPGDTYADIVSADLYFSSAFTGATSWALTGAFPRADYAALLAIATTSRKPMLMAELGANGAANAAHATVPGLWTQWGDDIATHFRGFATVSPWRPLAGPAPGDAAADSLRELAARRYCVTLDQP